MRKMYLSKSGCPWAKIYVSTSLFYFLIEICVTQVTGVIMLLTAKIIDSTFLENGDSCAKKGQGQFCLDFQVLSNDLSVYFAPKIVFWNFFWISSTNLDKFCEALFIAFFREVSPNLEQFFIWSKKFCLFCHFIVFRSTFK